MSTQQQYIPTAAKEVDQNFELNLAPIIDCLVVLITFTLASASFVAIAVMDAGYSPDSFSNQVQQQGSLSDPTISVNLQDGKNLVIEVVGKENLKRTISPITTSDGALNWNLPALKIELEQLSDKYGDKLDLSLLSLDTIEYEQVIIVMDQVRQTFPSVLLGGI